MATIKFVNGEHTNMLFDVKKIEKMKSAYLHAKDVTNLGDVFTMIERSDESLNVTNFIGYRHVMFMAKMKDGSEEHVITSCPTYLMNDEGKTIDRIY